MLLGPCRVLVGVRCSGAVVVRRRRRPGGRVGGLVRVRASVRSRR
ncbi:hypothetical protein [Rhodococcus opacus]